jgi:hypothetical protein
MSINLGQWEASAYHRSNAELEKYKPENHPSNNRQSFEELVKKIKTNHVKKALVEGSPKSSIVAKRDGINSFDFSTLQRCWETKHVLGKTMIHASFPWLFCLWKESPEYFTLTFEIINKDEKLSSDYLMIMLATLHEENNEQLMVVAQNALETSPNSLSILLREVLLSDQNGVNKAGNLEKIFKVIENSPQLLQLTAENMDQMRLLLPEEAMQLQLGASTLINTIQQLNREFKEQSDPNTLRREVLATLGIRPDIGILITEQLLALVLGDSFIGGSGLEGCYYRDAFKLISCFKECLPENLQKDLKAMLEWEEKISQRSPEKQDLFGKMATKLKTDKRLVVPAGWSNKRGEGGSHAMIAEAILCEDQKARVRLYNQGAGVHNHQRHSQQFRERRDNYFEIDDIPQELVLSPAFWMILQTLRVSSGSNPKPYTSEDIYGWFRAVLPGEERTATSQSVPQQSGTCTIQTPEAFFKSNTSEKEYDYFILRFKFGILARYEEDLRYRRPDIDLPQKKFLREIREKLKHSVEIHLKAGMIEDSVAELLKRYCEITPEFPGEIEKPKAPEQLVSVFTQSPPLSGFTPPCLERHMKQSKGISGFIESHVLEDKVDPFCNIQNSQEVCKAIKNTVTELSSYKESATERNALLLLRLVSYLPPLNQIYNYFKSDISTIQNSLGDIKTLLNSAKFITRKPSIGGVPTPLLYAWMSELANIFTFFVLKKNDLPLFYSIPYGQHHLEGPKSFLNHCQDPLSTLGEQLFQDWGVWRTSIKNLLRSFTISQPAQGNTHLIITKAQALDDKFFDSWCSKFNLDKTRVHGDHNKLLSYLFPGHFQVQLTAEYMKSEEGRNGRVLTSAIELLRTKIECDFNINYVSYNHIYSYQGSETITVKVQPLSTNPFHHSPKQPQREKAPLPFIGIEKEVGEIENNPAKITFFNPDNRWFLPSTIHKNNGFERGVPFINSLNTGKTPFDILSKSSSLPNVIKRLQVVGNQICSGSRDRVEVYTTLFRLAAKINLRNSKSNSPLIALTPASELYQRITSSAELIEAWSLYCLTSPQNHIKKEYILKAFYYLLINESIKQDDSHLAMNIEFLRNINAKELENELGQPLIETLWNEICALPIFGLAPTSIIYRKGTIYSNDIFQANCNRWHKSPFGKMLNELLGEITFGPWEKKPLLFLGKERIPSEEEMEANYREVTYRQWENSEKSYVIEEHLENASTICNGSVLKLRLQELGFTTPKDLIKDHEAYEVCPSITIKKLPPSMQKDHLEYWRPLGPIWSPGEQESKKTQGILIDPYEHQCYTVQLHNAGKQITYSIFDLEKNAKLLAGKVKGNGKLFFTWNGQTIRIPHLGQSSMDISIWASGKGKKTKFWINCMNGKLKFKVLHGKSNSFEYISEQYEGFKWSPAETVAEVGLLNGILLKKENEEILILPKQTIEGEHSSSYRPLWKNIEENQFGTLSRTLHPELESDDPAQTLFTCADPKYRMLVFQELMHQRNWERAHAYLTLIPPISKKENAQTKQYAEMIKQYTALFEKPRLDNPKARVLRLRLLARSAGIYPIDYLSTLGYSKSRLEKDYITYIKNYHLLDHGFILSTDEEKIISQWIDPKLQNMMIQDHLSRISEKDIEMLSPKSLTPPTIAPRGFNKISQVNQNPPISMWNSPPLNWLYRPPIRSTIFGGLMKRFLEPAPPGLRLLQTALLWFSLDGCPQLRDKVTPLLKKLLANSISDRVWNYDNSIQTFREEIIKLKNLNIVAPPGSELSLIDKLEKHLETADSTPTLMSIDVKSRGGEEELEEKDTRSKRQTVRQEFLNRSLLTPEQSIIWVKDAIARNFTDDEEVIPMEDIQELPNQVINTSSRKRKEHSRSSHDIMPIRPEKMMRPILSDSSSSSKDYKENWPSLQPKELKSTLEKEIKKLSFFQKIRTNKLKPLFSNPDKEKGKIGLKELFAWLDQLEGEPENSKEKEVAELLVNFAECSVELKTLKQTLKMVQSEEQIDEIDLRKSLAKASLNQFSLIPKTRYGLAAFMWYYQIALRYDQILIIDKIEKSLEGILAQADCGVGKSFAISPALCSLTKNLVINIVPPGISEEHARRLSKHSSSWKGALTNPLLTSRANITQEIPAIETAFKEARKQRVPIVTTVSDIASLFLRYYEGQLNKTIPISETTALETILKKFKENDTLLLDEIDTAAKEQIHWTIGAKSQIDKNRIEEVGTLYEAMWKIDEQCKQSLYCLDGKKRFCPEKYETVGMPRLINELLDLPIYSKICEKQQKKWVKEYLSIKRGAPGWEEIDTCFIKIDNSQVQTSLKWLRCQLHVYLPHTLKMRYNVHYGSSGRIEDMAAVPYKSAHFPDPKSQFTYQDIQANLTIQWMLQDVPCNITVNALIKRKFDVKETERVNYFAARWLGPNATIADLLAIAEHKEGSEELVKRFKESPFARLDIATDLRLPRIELATSVLRFTNATLTASASRPIGLTATPYNRKGMNQRLADNFLESNAYETSREIFKKSPVNTLPENLEFFIKNVLKNQNSHAVIDPNALLVDYTNEEIAKILLKDARAPIKHVVYWDIKKNRWVAISRNKRIEEYNESRHKSIECFFYFDQTRSRGMDLPLPKNCNVEVLVGQDCSFTTLKQATERARRIKEGQQTATFWMENTTIPSNKALLERLDKNEIELLTEELPLMARREMVEVCNQRLTETIWEYPKKEKELLSKHISLRLHKINHDNYKIHSELKPHQSIDKDLLQFEEDLLEKYKELINDKDCKLIRACRERACDAIGEKRLAPSKAAVDLRGEVINASSTEQQTNHNHKEFELRGETHHQQQVRVQSQAVLEKRKLQQKEEALWDPQQVLPFLAKPKTNIARIENQDPNWGPFIAEKINKLFPSLIVANNIWISKKLTFLNNGKLTTEEIINKSLHANLLWKALPKASHLLSVSLREESSPSASSSSQIPVIQHIALNEIEADQVEQYMRDTQKVSKLPITLHKIDGSPTTSSPTDNSDLTPLAPSVLATIALFNGRLGRLQSNIIQSLGDDKKSCELRLSFLKNRLGHYRMEEEQSFENNPLVREIQQIPESTL